MYLELRGIGEARLDAGVLSNMMCLYSILFDNGCLLLLKIDDRLCSKDGVDIIHVKRNSCVCV